MYKCNRCKVDLTTKISFGNGDGNGSNFVCCSCYALINIKKALKDLEFGELRIAKEYLSEAYRALDIENPRK